MDSWVIQALLNFTESAVSMLFADLVFRGETGLKRLPVLLLYSAAGAALLTGIGGYPEWIPEALAEILIVVLYGILACRAAWWKSLALALGNYLMILMVTTGVSTLIGILVPQTSMFYLQKPYYLWVLVSVTIRIAQMLASLLALWAVRRADKRQRIQGNELLLILLFGMSIFLLICWLRRQMLLTGMLHSYFYGILCLVIAAVNLFVLYMAELMTGIRKKNEELRIENGIMAAQVKGQKEVSASYQELRALKHDMTDHLRAVEGYLRDGEYQRAEDYITSILGKIQEIVSYRTGNSALDFLIGSKEAAARRNHIRVNTRIRLNTPVRIPDEDLVILIGNLYDNATEACCRMPEGEERCIDIRILTEKENMLVYFENTAPQSEWAGISEGSGSAGKSGRFKTTKGDAASHGFGLRNIDRMVAKYDGYCERSQDASGRFVCAVRIRNCGKNTYTA